MIHCPAPLLSLVLLMTPLQAEIAVEPLADTGSPLGKFTRLSAETTGIALSYRFPSGAPFALMTDQYSGNGICIGDVDGDALPDLYLTHYDQGNRLYRNLGDWKFADITESAGVTGAGAWCAGPSFADIDSDGDLDLHVCVFNGPNLLYRNNGKGQFTEIAASAGLDFQGPSVMMAFADYDLDGDLDAYLVTHRMPLEEKAKPPRTSKEAFDRGIIEVVTENGKRRATVTPEYRDLFTIMDKGEGRIELATAGNADVLYQNDGKGNFTNVSMTAGIAGRDIGLAATWWDANGDGYPDLYVSNDYKGPDHFYLNQKNGTFKDVTRTALPHIPWLSMGSDFSDINRDGRMDFMATDMAATTHYQQKVSMGDMEKDQWFLNLSDPRQMMRNAVYVNTGSSRFTEAAFLTGLASTDWTWSPKFGDLDNDGWEDLFVTNGMSRDFMNSDLASKTPSRWRSDAWGKTPILKQKNLAFRNTGDLYFEKRGQAWGLDQLAASYGAAYGDFDRDGDLDLVVVNFDEPVSVFRNDLNTNNRLTVAFQLPTGNRHGIGAEVELQTPSGKQTKQLALARGFMSANEPRLHFGLGQDSIVSKLTVRLAGQEAVIENLKANQQVTIRGGFSIGKPLATKTPLYSQVRLPSMPSPHRETPFNDYDRQPLLPMKHSQMGPCIAVADVNGDGTDDFYLGGAAGQSGQLILVGKKGARMVAPFGKHAAREDLGALFFDADGDGDQDLYVVSGGVECEPGSPLLKDRLYQNDGKGTFTDVSERLPANTSSGSGVATADMDQDGDLDLFVGSRLVPGSYPEAPKSQLLINENGTFKDHGHLLDTDMVTSALWTDLNLDGWQDLVVAQDWGPLKCWLNEKGTLKETSGLAKWPGWWRGLASRDLDGDGDPDLVATNLGLNTKYKASASHPLQLYYGDLAGTGERRLVEAGYEADTLYPKRGKSCSTRAMPALGERFTSYHQFASATLTEIYGQRLDKAVKRSVTTLDSGAFLNEGEGRFTWKPFPRVAQQSPGYGIAIAELNGDAHPDVYFVQNDFQPQAETGRFDSGLSQVLFGKGDGTFEAPSEPTGLIVPGDATALAMVDWNADGGADWLIGQNDGPVLVFQRGKGSTPTVMVRLIGSNIAGTRVQVTSEAGTTQTAELQQGSGYLSQGASKLNFGGVGEGAKLLIHWPSGGETAGRISGPVTTYHAPQP